MKNFLSQFKNLQLSLTKSNKDFPRKDVKKKKKQ